MKTVTITYTESLTAITNTNIKTAVALWASNQQSCLDTYGHISNWNTTSVTEMNWLCYSGALTLNANLNDWDTSNVTSMVSTFQGGSAFTNGGVALTWDTRKVTNMEGMFSHGSVFNQGFGPRWDTSKVINMYAMFLNNTTFNQDIASWDTSNVLNMNHMFSGATSFHQDLKGWNVGKVVGYGNEGGLPFYNMFNGATKMRALNPYNAPISPTSSWFDGGFHYPFANKTELQTAVAQWLTDQSHDTYGYIGYWDVSKVTDMSRLFEYKWTNNMTGFDLSYWDTSKVTAMNHMFILSNFDNNNKPLTWDVSNVVDMRYMFQYGLFEADISTWNVWKVTQFHHMFGSRVEHPGGRHPMYQKRSTMFQNWYVLPNATGLLHNSNYGLSVPPNDWNVLNANGVRPTEMTQDDFNAAIADWFSVDTGIIDASTTVGRTRDANPLHGHIEVWNTSIVTDMSWKFSNKTGFNRDISKWNTGLVVDMNHMFELCSIFNQDIGNWNTGSVVDMNHMFRMCSIFNNGEQPMNTVGNSWNVSSVTNMTNMFAHEWKFNQNISN